MNVYRRAARLAVRRVPGLDDVQRADIAVTLDDLAAAEPAGRWRELAGILRLGFRLRSRVDTDDRPDAAWRQGLHRGGVLLLCVSAADAIAAARPVGAGATTAGAVAVGVAVAVALVVAAWTGARGRAFATATLTVPAVLIAVLAQPTIAVQPVALRAVVALVALAIGAPPSREHQSLCPWRWMTLTAIAAVAAVAVDPGVVSAGLTIGVPLLWLLASAVDPRLAVGAAVALFWRLVALDLHELADATLAVPVGHELDLLLLRWVAMAAGVLAALAVARRSIHKAADV